MVHSIFGVSGALPRPAERMGEFQTGRGNERDVTGIRGQSLRRLWANKLLDGFR